MHVEWAAVELLVGGERGRGANAEARGFASYAAALEYSGVGNVTGEAGVEGVQRAEVLQPGVERACAA